MKVNKNKGLVVGVRGFEPPTPTSRMKCSTKLSYTPMVYGIPQSLIAQIC